MKKASGASQESNNIRVVCRCRPLNKLEIELGGEQCVKILDSTNVQVSIAGEDQPHNFTFDKIFPSDTRQVDVFHEVGQPVLDSVMKGINSTIFAYGQTSSGKTHTMEGKHDDPEYMGLIPRMMERLFEMIAEAPSSMEFNIKASFLEIYNEKIQDLLDTSKTNLSVKEDKLRGIFVADATEAFVARASDMMKVMRKGTENRSVAATRMNERSSRSHSIFLLTLIQKNTETETSRLSKLYFVDLAGSEKISKTNVTGQQLEEAKNINKSLTCLGIVINSLSEKKDFIPYRDSKLTRILQESIGGNSKTTLIIACSMCSYNDKETVGTLRFGQRAKSIKNSAKVNEERSAKELMQLLSKAENMLKYKDEVIAALQLQLGAEGTRNMNKSYSVAEMHFESQSLLKSDIPPTINALPSNNEQLIKEQSQSQEEPEKSKRILPKDQQSAQSSRKLLEQHLEIIKLKEKIDEISSEKQDLVLDCSNKAAELQNVNEKNKQLTEMLEQEQSEARKLNEKFSRQIEAQRQEQSVWISCSRDLKKSTKRLSSDLGFLLVSAKIDSTPTNNDQAVHSTIQNTIDEIETITNSICRFEKIRSLSYLPDIEENTGELNENEGKYPRTETDFLSLTRKDSQKFKTFGSPRKSLNAQQRVLSRNQSTSDYNEVLSTEADDRIPTEESVQSGMSQSNGAELILEKEEASDNSDEEDIKSIMELTSCMSEIPESQQIDLQTYIISLKKQVRKLGSKNSEIGQNAMNETIMAKYSRKLSEIKKNYNLKFKESETKNAQLHSLLVEKQQEISEVQHRFEKQIQEKNQSLTNLKVDFENLKKVIQSNHPASKIAELQQKIKELGTDRQKLFNDLFMARKDLDEKEVEIKEKEAAISLLRKTIPKQATSEFHNIKQNNELFVTPRATIVDRRASGVGGTLVPSTISNQSSASKAISLKSHIAPSIRGGDGNLASFQKNNQYIFDDPFIDGISSPKSQQQSQSDLKQSITPASPVVKELKLISSNTKKFMNLIEEEQEMAQSYAMLEPTQQDMQKSFKKIIQSQQSQSKPEKNVSTSIFGVMKKIFS